MKGQLGYVTVVKMVIGILLVFLAFSIGKSCADALLPSMSESVKSFNNFVDAIEKTRNFGFTQQTAGLVMDQNTAIFGFGKGVLLIYKKGESTYTIVRPQNCGDKKNACVCLCGQVSKTAVTAAAATTILGPISASPSFSCNSDYLRCRPLSDDIDFAFPTPIIKLVPLGTSIREAAGQERSAFAVDFGFVFERPVKNPYFLIEKVPFVFLNIDLPDAPKDGLFPRRFTVSIEKSKDDKLGICARPPCTEVNT